MRQPKRIYQFAEGEYSGRYYHEESAIKGVVTRLKKSNDRYNRMRVNRGEEAHEFEIPKILAADINEWKEVTIDGLG